MRISVPSRSRAIVYGFGALAEAMVGFIVYDAFFILNVIVMTIALYAANSIVVGEKEPELVLNVLIISLSAFLVSNLAFSFLQQFIALSISLLSLLVLIKYFLVKNHDSGWFGAMCTGLLGLLFLFIIEVPLALILAMIPPVTFMGTFF